MGVIVHCMFVIVLQLVIACACSANLLVPTANVVIPSSFDLLAMLLQRSNLFCMVDTGNSSLRVFRTGSKNFYNTYPIDSGLFILLSAYVKHREITQCLVDRFELANDSEEALRVCIS